MRRIKPFHFHSNSDSRRKKAPGTLAATECSQVEALLTATFDGEVDEACASAAESHLAACPHCNRLWHEWEKTRVLLRGVPSPATPSPLLTRVLLSCRLLPIASDPLQVQSKLAQSQQAELCASLCGYLDSPIDEVADAPLAKFIGNAPVPTELQNQILQLTTRAETAVRVSTTARPARGLFWISVREAFFGLGTSRGSGQAFRWGTGLAVPAMVALLVFAGRFEYSVVPPLSSTTPEANVVTQQSPLQQPSPSAKQQDGNSLMGSLKAITRAAKKLPNAVAEAITAPAVAAAAERPSQRAPRVTAANLPASGPVLLAKLPTAGPPVPVAVPVTPRPLVRRTNRRPAVDIVERRMRITNASVSLASTNRFSSGIRASRRADLKISMPETPAPRVVKMPELDLEEAFAAVTRERDLRPVDLGNALDEYRAHLIAEAFSDEEGMDDI